MTDLNDKGKEQIRETGITKENSYSDIKGSQKGSRERERKVLPPTS